MAERTLTSPGITTREIDLSGPRNAQPFGVPAGIIGTADRGPAFVPVTFGTTQDFFAKFGETDGKKFGPIAVSEWMRNSTAGTYVRVLGAGNGKKRSTSTGIVSNAGFAVGQKLPQGNGLIGNNTYANAGADGSGVHGVGGNIFFLACLMSESAGSTVFSTAGLQEKGQNIATSILRGVIMAPSGVCLMLSGNRVDAAKGNTPLSTTVATVAGPFGSSTGSLNLSGDGSDFVLLLNGHKGSATYPNIQSASLNPTSPSYLSKVLNTDLLKLEQAGHVLYTHYDIDEALAVPTGSGLVTPSVSGSYINTAQNLQLEEIIFIVTGSTGHLGAGASGKPDYRNFENRFTASRSPWVISQVNANLFKIHTLDDGQIRSTNAAKAPNMPGANDRYKVSVRNIRKSSSTTDLFGSFDIVIRDFYDTDDDPIELESFAGLSLDPSSPNYIASRVGDLVTFFDFDKVDDEQRLVVEGSFPNVSNYVRVEMATDVSAADVDAGSLPVGFRGLDHLVLSGTTELGAVWADTEVFTGVPADLSNSPVGLTNEPPVPFRQHLIAATSGALDATVNKSLNWGIQFERKLSVKGPNVSKLPNPTLASMTSFFPNFRIGITNASTGSNPGAPRVSGGIMDADLFNNNLFTLNNIKIKTGSNGNVDTSTVLHWEYVRKGNITPNNSTKTRALSVTDDYGDTTLIQYLKYNFLVEGGFNGLNAFNKAKVEMSNAAVRREMLDTTSESLKQSATVAAYLKAIDIMGRTSDVEIKLLAIPGIRYSTVTDEAISTVENRFDALYIMDIEERDNINSVVTSSAQTPHVQNTVAAFTSRALDTSFAAAYFPDVTVVDPVKQTLVNAPPSVAVLGAFALNDKVAHPWFAPAGFARGSLASTEDVAVRINQDNQDRLYEADINPIRTFPNRSGVYIFGQKTLQSAQSALDRINVRRLLIDIRRQVRNIANRFLFEPNRESTLAAFSASVQPVLQRIQQQQGVDRYKVIIDASTTTQADVENNTIRGKIFLQPTRSVEFVSLDFVVTNAGAEE